MIKELDVLRKKTLMLWCYVGYNWRVVIWYCLESTSPNCDNKFRFNDWVYLDREECEAMGILWHPLTFWRIVLLCTELEKQFANTEKIIFKSGFRVNKSMMRELLEDESDWKRLVINSIILESLKFFKERPYLCDENESMRETHSDREILKWILIRLAKYFTS